MFDEFAVLVVGVGLFGEQLDAFAQIGSDGDAAFGWFVAGGEPDVEDVGDLAGCAAGPGGQIRDQFVTAAQDVRGTRFDVPRSCSGGRRPSRLG